MHFLCLSELRPEPGIEWMGNQHRMCLAAESRLTTLNGNQPVHGRTYFGICVYVINKLLPKSICSSVMLDEHLLYSCLVGKCLYWSYCLYEYIAVATTIHAPAIGISIWLISQNLLWWRSIKKEQSLSIEYLTRTMSLSKLNPSA